MFYVTGDIKILKKDFVPSAGKGVANHGVKWTDKANLRRVCG